MDMKSSSDEQYVETRYISEKQKIGHLPTVIEKSHRIYPPVACSY